MRQEKRNQRQTSPPRGHLRLAAVILAAGHSRRMGRPKLVLPWEADTVLGHILGQWRKLGAAQIGVVIGPGLSEVSRELDRLGVEEGQRILNADPDRGMFSSIRTAATWRGWTREITHWAIILGDQPQLRLKTLQGVVRLSTLNPDRVCQPAYEGKRGHPVILPAKIFRAVAASSAPTLRDFLGEIAPKTVAAEVPDPELHLDLDTPEDYARACLRLRTFTRQCRQP